MNHTVQHETHTRPSAPNDAPSSERRRPAHGDAGERLSQFSNVNAAIPVRNVPASQLIEEMLGVSGDDDVTYRVISELEELLRALSWSLIEENHADSSMAAMAYNRARAAVELYERRGLLRGGVAALDSAKREGTTARRHSCGAAARDEADRVVECVQDGTNGAREVAEALFMAARRLARLSTAIDSSHRTEAAALEKVVNAKYAELVTQLADIDEMVNTFEPAVEDLDDKGRVSDAAAEE